MSYGQPESPHNKVLSIIALVCGIVGVSGPSLLTLSGMYLFGEIFLFAEPLLVAGLQGLLYMSIGCAPFAIAGLVIGAIAKGPKEPDSETRQMAVAGFLCGMCFIAYAVLVIGFVILVRIASVRF